jgi:hypothetical protein
MGFGGFFVLKIVVLLILITTLATPPTIANTALNTPNKTTAIVGLNLQANAVNSDNANNAVNTRVGLYFYDKRVASSFSSITFVSLLMYPQNHIVQGHTHI